MQVLAHGIGDRQDLPIPFTFALFGAAVAVVISFVAAAVLWRTSRLRGDAAGRPVPPWLQSAVDSLVGRGMLRAVGLAIVMFVAAAAVLGLDDDGVNPTAGFVYVLFWVGLVPASLLFGPVWRWLNPLRTIHAAVTAGLRLPRGRGMWAYPRWLGYWPAALGLFAFTWLELVAPGRTSTTVVLVWFTAYAAVQLLGALAFGTVWFARADAFEVYSTFIGRLAPLGRRSDGRIVVRNPLNGLDGLHIAPGVVAVVCVLLGSTAYDSVSNAPFWITAVQSMPLSSVAMGTVGLTGAVLAVAGIYLVGVGAAGLVAKTFERGFVAGFAHSIVPIAVGYLVAHYFSLLVFEGQRTLILASDPLGTGANLFGTAGRGVDYGLLTSTTIAVVQVAAVVTGHIVGVVAAHDRAVRLFPGRAAVLGQLPLLVLMVAYTIGGLTLLFAA